MDNFGQMFISGIKGTTLSSEEREFLEDEKIGGVILSSHNFEDPGQLAELVNSIQKIRDEYPLFVGVEQEGKNPLPFNKYFTQFPSMLEVSSFDSPKLIFEIHQVMAKELAACGINMIISPCCETFGLNSNSTIAHRSFGQTPETVEKYISAAIRGLQTSGLLSCANYFPGHGTSSKNAEDELPMNKTTLLDLVQKDLVPFIKASKSRVEFFMMGHILVDVLDQKMPSSLSSKVYQFLRQETKFTKLVLTDFMDRKAISDRYNTELAAVLALSAGADILLYRSTEETKKSLLAIREGVKKKTLKRDDLVEKLSRIEKCKKENFANYRPIYIPQIVDAFNSLESKKILGQLKKAPEPNF